MTNQIVTLTPTEKRALKARAHALNPVVMIGTDGLTPGVLTEIDKSLKHHELLKIRVFSDDKAEREALLTEITTRLNATAVQHIGKLLVVYRPEPVDMDKKYPIKTIKKNSAGKIVSKKQRLKRQFQSD